MNNINNEKKINDCQCLREYTVTTNATDEKDDLTIMAILDYFQDIAGYHARNLNCSYEFLKEKGLIWVLVKNRVEVIKSIELYSNISVLTYQSFRGKANFEREYFMYDEKGNLCAKGSSKWCIIDAKTNRIVSTKDFANDLIYSEVVAFDTPFNTIPPLNEFDYQYKYQVMYSDIDHNHHMNNSKYVKPMIDFLMTIEKKKVKYFETHYLSQSYLNDELTYLFKKDNNKYTITVLKDKMVINNSILILE